MRLTLIAAALLLTLAACESSDPAAAGATVVPAADAMDAGSPGQSAGVESDLLGAIRLSDEFPTMEGWVMRARVVTVAPEGQVAVHRHESRPEVVYVLEGEMIEHRNDDPPALRRVGEAAFENTGTVHWWENASERPARVIVVDIVPGEP